MSRPREGERAGALIGSNAETKVVQFLGYGTMLADCIPGEEAVGMFADMAREAQITVPAIQLDGDNAPIVYGPEVWFSGEEAMRQRVARWEEMGWTIQRVEMAEIRKEWREAARAREQEPT